ncbi:MAG: hypothetical protein M3437_19335, partial [Chloroflexota bacterium]|nr:hypothetical protein [Chloroflexota bacterium]
MDRPGGTAGGNVGGGQGGDVKRDAVKGVRFRECHLVGFAGPKLPPVILSVAKDLKKVS